MEIKDHIMQTITITINDNKNVDFLVDLLSKFAFIENIKTDSDQVQLQEKEIINPIRPGIGKPSIDDFAGLWQSNPKTLEQIREQAWKRSS